MFRKVYKEAINEIKIDEALINKTIENAYKQKKHRFNVRVIYPVAAAFVVVIGAATALPKLIDTPVQENTIQDASSDLMPQNTAAAVNPKGSDSSGVLDVSEEITKTEPPVADQSKKEEKKPVETPFVTPKSFSVMLPITTESPKSHEANAYRAASSAGTAAKENSDSANIGAKSTELPKSTDSGVKNIAHEDISGSAEEASAENRMAADSYSLPISTAVAEKTDESSVSTEVLSVPDNVLYASPSSGTEDDVTSGGGGSPKLKSSGMIEYDETKSTEEYIEYLGYDFRNDLVFTDAFQDITYGTHTIVPNSYDEAEFVYAADGGKQLSIRVSKTEAENAASEINSSDGEKVSLSGNTTLWYGSEKDGFTVRFVKNSVSFTVTTQSISREELVEIISNVASL